jgi:predicted glycosyltransferase
LLKADAILAANTSVMFEALSLGIPVINLKDPLSIILFDKIEEVNEVLWYTANNLAELSDAIVRILNLNIEDAMTEGYRLRNYFFTKLEPQLIFQLFT